MRKSLFTLALLIVASLSVSAQLKVMGFVEYGAAVLKYKTDELPVFLSAYNGTYPDLTKPFETKIGGARGMYYKFGIGFGDESVQMIVDLGIYKTKTSPLEARFADGSGRDIWAEHRTSMSTIGVRFGGSEKVRVYGQFNINLGVQSSSIYAAFVYPDGSRSLGNEKTLNGVYSDFAMVGGFGLAAGYRIIGPLAVNVSANYTFNGGKGNPEYHQYIDLNDVKPEGTQDYIPRDLAMYVNDPYNGSNNSISNDFRGLEFNVGLVALLGNWED